MMQTEEKVKTTTTGGRKRAHLVKFFLNDEEYEKLCKDAASLSITNFHSLLNSCPSSW